jgi:hypothetical protein
LEPLPFPIAYDNDAVIVVYAPEIDLEYQSTLFAVLPLLTSFHLKANVLDVAPFVDITAAPSINPISFQDDADPPSFVGEPTLTQLQFPSVG